MKTIEVAQRPTTWIARVNLGRQMRDSGEKMVADALRERLDKVGEATWLKEVEREWGWSRTTAYNHLNPELLQKDRARAAARRSDSLNIDPADQAVAEWATAAEKTLADPTKSLEDVATIERQAGGIITALAERRLRAQRALGAMLNETETVEPAPGPKSLTAMAAKTKTAERALPRGQQEAPPNPLVPENRVYQADGALGSIRWGLEMLEKNPRCLTPKRVEILGALWDRLSVVLEQYGNEGGTAEDLDTTPEAAAVDGRA